MDNGKITGNVLKRSVLRPLVNKNTEVLQGAGIGNDCAFFALSENEKMVSSVTEGALETYGKSVYSDSVSNIIDKALNNVALSALPFAIGVSLIFPTGTTEDEIQTVMKEVAAIAIERKVSVACGETHIKPYVTNPVVNVTAYGKTKTDPKDFKPKKGQDIILTKWIGLSGTYKLAECFYEKLTARLPKYYVDEAKEYFRMISVIPEAALALKSDGCFMHDASEGGIFASLWEMAEKAGVGLSVDIKKIPIKQQTVEICEVLGANPYELDAAGCLIITAFDGEAIEKSLLENGINASVIGKITGDKKRVILNEDEVRYMDRPATDSKYTMV